MLIKPGSLTLPVDTRFDALTVVVFAVVCDSRSVRPSWIRVSTRAVIAMEPEDSRTNMDVNNEVTPLVTLSGDPTSPPPPPEDKSPCPGSRKQELVDALQQIRSLQATPSAAEATPIASQATPNIPQATPISISSPTSSSNSFCTNSFFSLQNRHTVVDCYPSLPALKRKLYGLPSMVQRLTLETRLKEHQGCVNCINFSWTGHLLASGSDDLQVVLWDWASGKVANKFDTGHVANVFQVN